MKRSIKRIATTPAYKINKHYQNLMKVYSSMTFDDLSKECGDTDKRINELLGL